jgi:adenylate cyclase
MAAVDAGASLRSRRLARSALAGRWLGLGQQPGDDDDARLRKRVGVIACSVTIVGPIALLAIAQGSGAGTIEVAFGSLLSALSIANLAVFARTRAFERFVIVLIVACMLVTTFTDVVLGGLAASSVGIVFALLGPVYAVLALGPHRATPWFALFVAVLVGVILVDPFVRTTGTPPPYPVQLVFYAWNIGVPGLIIFLLLRYTDLRRLAAQARSDELLTNAIPASIARRLKDGEDRIADVHPETTVLFADIVGFTAWAQRTDPARVVGLLDSLFTRFDHLAAGLGVEKIKTIGDAYMAVAGVPVPRSDHAEAALQMALGMLESVDQWDTANNLHLQIRVGLASGSVVAGVIGRRRILFDLWGDTVNMASRMESTGVPGRVQVAPETWLLLRDQHPFERREIEAKGLGRMSTYLLVAV